MFELMPYGHRSVFDDLDRFEREFNGEVRERSRFFRTDVVERDNGFTLRAELPGFAKEDITVDIDGDCLTVKAERKSENTEKDGERYIRREITCGKYVRSFDITGIDESAISARYRDGILELDLPKRAQAAPSARTVEIQ